uniref:Dr1-associated corepressor n=1 Tax=Strigamia maritima TaxID=126957 RepID=T1IQP6_STRMM
MPSKKKKYNARFPPARIKKIMQTDDEVGKVAAPVPFPPRALELFVESLINKANEYTQLRNAKTLSTSHLKQCILAENKFDFLKDLVETIPDIQIEDDTSNSSVTSPAGTVTPLSGELIKGTLTKTKKQKRRKRTKQKDINDDPGPSCSGAEETESSQEEEEEEEIANNVSVQLPMAVDPVRSTNNTLGSIPPNIPASLPAVPIVPISMLNQDDDEDYDS